MSEQREKALKYEFVFFDGNSLDFEGFHVGEVHIDGMVQPKYVTISGAVIVINTSQTIYRCYKEIEEKDELSVEEV